MTNEQVFTILGIAKGQARSRSKHIKTKDGREFNVNYDPKEAKEHKANIAAQVVQQNPIFFAKGTPILLHVQVYLPRPLGHYRANGQLKDWAPAYCPTKPDGDNIIKGIKDSLKGICWQDDAQVADERIIKLYGEIPKTVVTVRAL
jgi:Holliday junction resolvase RusA-like endonuclease